ncbi:MAG: hypothetical protein DRJ99_03425 [Thermoplasmata archaeon]|nr:MAG: hypothetical protein DRJ99_03425 [Thermoplasmata archaeon]
MQVNQSIGLIYGNVGSTEFNFTVENPDLKKFDYIAVPHKDCGVVLAQVMDIRCFSDFSFDDAKSLLNNDLEGLNVKIEGDLSAHANVIGYRDAKGYLQTPRRPFEVGERVFLADKELIRNVLGLSSNEKNGAYIGLLKGHNLPVYLSIDALIQKHICILAKTGGGKSYACGVLVEEMLKKKIPLVIIDPHGEYVSLAEPNKEKNEIANMQRYKISPKGYKDQIMEFSPLYKRSEDVVHLTLDGRNLEAREIIDLLPNKLSGPQMGVLYQAIKEIKEYKSVYNLRDIIEAVNRSKSSAKWAVIAALEALESIGVFSDNGLPPEGFVKKGRCSIINLRGVPPDIQDVIVARLSKELFDARKSGKAPPFLMIVEEAHNYCPERGFGNAVSSNILRTIASEGRKFGMGLCVVSQRPAKIDKNIISQCNTNIILKVTNPNDLKAIVQSVEGLTTETADEIQRLPVGVALVAGGSLSLPILVEIRTRETKHGGKSINVISKGEEFPKPTSTIAKERYTTTIPPPPKTIERPTKAEYVHRVANRLGWVQTSDPQETIEILSKEAKKMKEDIYKYLDSLAKLGKVFCHEKEPNCIRCPMNEVCKYRKEKTLVKRKGLIFR